MLEGVRSNCLIEHVNASKGEDVYGVVIDFKPRKFSNESYVTSARIIDNSWNQNIHPENLEPYVELILNSNNKNNLVKFTTVGDIIHIGKFNIEHSTSLKFLCDSQCTTLISSTNEEVNNKRIEFLKLFAKEYLTNHLVIHDNINLKKGKRAGRFTTTVILKKKVRINDKEYLKVVDSTSKAYLNAILVAKNIKYEDMIQLEDDSTLMVTPSYTEYAKKFLEEYYMRNMGKKTRARIKEERTYKVASQIMNESIELSTVSSAIYGPNLKYRIRVFVITAGPNDIHNWVKGYCNKCNISFILNKNDNDDKPLCIKCKEEGKVIYQVQFFVRERNQRNSEIVYRLLLYTNTNKGEDFFDHEPPVNLYRNQRLYKKLKALYSLLKQPHVFLDCIIDKSNKIDLLENDGDIIGEVIDEKFNVERGAVERLKIEKMEVDNKVEEKNLVIDKPNESEALVINSTVIGYDYLKDLNINYGDKSEGSRREFR